MVVHVNVTALQFQMNTSTENYTGIRQLKLMYTERICYMVAGPFSWKKRHYPLNPMVTFTLAKRYRALPFIAWLISVRDMCVTNINAIKKGILNCHTDKLTVWFEHKLSCTCIVNRPVAQIHQCTRRRSSHYASSLTKVCTYVHIYFTKWSVLGYLIHCGIYERVLSKWYAIILASTNMAAPDEIKPQKATSYCLNNWQL